MTKKFVGIFLLSLLLLVTLSGCDFFKSYYELEEIHDNLRAALAEEYGFPLPDTAVFVEGYMDVGLRDPHVQLIIRIPQNDFAGLMNEEWVELNQSTTIEGMRSEAAYWRSGDDQYDRSASLYVTAPDENGIVSVLFDGDNPSTRWLD